MVRFKFSVDNGHYPAGSVVDLAYETAKLFESLKWGSIQNEKKPMPKINVKKSK